jgi:hypothetical protein
MCFLCLRFRRSTGLAGNLTSPSTDFAPASSPSADESPGGQQRGSIVGLRATKFSSSLGTASSLSPSPGLTETSPSPTAGSLAKPKPLPKPRPWSIVGLDRKSGEMTSVVGGSGESPPGGRADDDADSSTLSAASGSPSTRKSSVRDLINNMNRGEPSPGAAASASAKKGNSLPRGTPASSTATAAGDASPKTTAKKESTSDDPRILKLDDDFGYDDVMEV